MATIKKFFREHEVASLFALRMGLSATLAYLAAVFIHAPETTWPVMSAIIVSRVSGQSPGGSAIDRLVGTLAGAGVGLAAGFGYHYGIPEYLLLALAITPLAFLSSDYSAFRAAPIAALIVMSAAALGRPGNGLGPAMLRVGDVGLGTIVALCVSRFVVPSFPARALKRQIAQLMTPLSNLFALAWRRDEASREKFPRLALRTRRQLRDAAMLARAIARKRGEDEETPANQIVAIAGRAQGAIVFIQRALGAADPPPELREAAAPYFHAVRARFAAIADALERNAAPGPAPELDAALSDAIARIEAFAPASRLQALPFLLQTLRDDLNDLATAAANISR